MRSLLESTDQVAAARRLGQSNRSPAPIYHKINEFWRHAQRLHAALSKAWQCGWMTHIANLGLKHRTSEKLEFNLLFDLTVAGIRSTKIKVIETSSAPRTQVTQHGSPASGHTRRQVRFNPSTPPSDPFQSLTQINDLCSLLSTPCLDCIGFLEEDEHRFAVYPDAQLPSILCKSTKTLQDLLADVEMLTRRKRYRLALILASSYLQLGATPWLNTQLRKDSIISLQDSSDPNVTLLDHPYIGREMSKNNDGQSADVLASLGIRLLELCFGKSLEATQFRKQLPAGDTTSAPILDYAAAIQWSKQAGEEAGPEFAEAIDWCLHAKEPSDSSWGKDLLQHVVVPLDACHKQVSQKPWII